MASAALIDDPALDVTPSIPTADHDAAPQTPNRTAGSGKGMSRYATIIVSVALFLVFDLGVLVMNFFISAQIAEDAVAVNLAGRQRMLSQRMVKTLLLTETRAATGGAVEDPLRELGLTVDLFDSTLKAFETGDTVTGTTGKPLFISPADTPEGTAIVSKAKRIWTPYNELISEATAGGLLNRAALNRAIDYGVANNLTLLKLMNDLTNERESVASDRAQNLRMIQAGGIMLALINFVIILFHFIRKLRDADSETERHALELERSNNNLEDAKQDLEAAKRETDEILETVNEGLFLINAEGVIGDQHSRDLERILPDRQLAGESLANLLRPLLSDKDYAMTLDYLRLLFQPRLKEKMLLNVNPLEEVEVNITDGSAGGAQNRVLSFAFNRVYDGKSILHVLVSVTDVTDKVMLARELEASRERAREQMELLFGIVHVEPARVSAFLAETRTRVGNVNELLKTAEIGGSGNLHGLVDGIFRQIHAVKGDAAMLGLALFENAAHRFEDELNRLREQSDIKGQDFVPLALGLDEMRRYLVETGELVDKIAGFGELSTEKAPDLIDSLQGLITDIADKVDRRVELSAHDFDPRLIPATATQQIKDILIQLIRNAVSHGIEHPDERRGRNKPETGQVRLSARKADGKVEISVRDDGAGIQIGRIRRKALERGLRSPDELEAMNNRQVVSLIFEPGFSTADEVNEVAGRGVGMDIVRDEIARMGGRIRLAYAPDSFTEFTLIVPEDAGATTPA